MRLTASILIVLVILTGSAVAQTVSVDYDKEYENVKVKTFAWVESAGTTVADVDPLLHSRIVNGIEYYLTHAGMTQVGQDENPDVYVTYHASTKQEVHLNTTTMGYGYPSGWAYGGGYYGGVGATSTTVSTYQTGTLVVDAWDAKTEKLIWRGIASNIVVTQDPEKMKGKIDKALKKMVDKWGQIKENNAKEKAKAEKKAAKEAAKK